MRPVNLIPPDERRGEQAPLRTGALVYLVLGAFVAILVGVTALVLIDNKIADRETEVVELHRENAAAERKAERLASYTEFRTLSEQRVQTISSLADSRFDWERVMRELALVLPHDVWLLDLTATATAGVSVEGASAGASDLRSLSAGPALEIKGCATGQEAVAGFVSDLKDIDGVTRVGMKSSELAGEDEGAGTNSGDAGSESEDCRTRKFITMFEMAVAFDAAPVPVTGTGGGEVTTAVEPEESSESSEGESEEG